jgi:HEAT repeat protein
MPHDFLYGTRTRRVASAGLDGLTPILLVAYVLGAIGAGVYAHTQLPKLAEQGVPTLSPSVLWTSIILGIVMLFAVSGPMVLLGVFIASKVMKFPLSGAAYLKACGVAALPWLMLTLANVLPQNIALRLLVVLAIIPAVFFVIKTTYELTFGEGAVTFVMSGITGVIGLVISIAIVGAVAAVGVISEKQTVAGGGNPAIDVIPKLPGVTTPVAPSPRSTQTNPGPAKSPVESLKESLVNQLATPSAQSREAQERSLASLRTQATHAGATGDAEVAKLLKELEGRAAAAPSEKPDPAIYQELIATTAWTPTEAQAALLSPDEVSFKGFNLRVPKDFKADLSSSESDAKGLVFSAGRAGADRGRIVLRTAPANNAKQRRPWMTTERFQRDAAEREKLLAVEGGTSEAGKINDVAFTRIVHEPGQRFGVHGRSAQYVARTGDGWLVAEAVAPSNEPAALERLEASIRTIRPRPEGDPKADPFAPELLASRLAEDPERIAQLLRARGKEAEAAVLPLLKSAEPRAARAAAQVLGDIGSEKSLPALQEAARANDTLLANAARDAIKKLKPADDVENALLDLETGNVFKKREALQRLAKATPDDARREKVADALEKEVLGDNLFSLSEDIGPALGVWAGKDTVTKILPLLDKDSPPHKRRVGMEVAGRLKDKRAVLPVVRWILLDTENASKSLIEMGAIAEDEVIKLTKEPNATARTAAARILQEIGTGKSLSPLRRAAQDPRDAGAAAAARVALEIVNERWKASKATAGATTAPAD